MSRKRRLRDEEEEVLDSIQIPEEEKTYPVVLGKSFFNACNFCPSKSTEKQRQTIAPSPPTSDDHYCTLRYEFQPASVDKKLPGLITTDSSNGIHIQMGNSSGAPGGILFKGKIAETKETDFLLVFDGTEFHLEKSILTGTQLRHVRAPSKKRVIEKRVDVSETNQSANAWTTKNKTS